MFGVRTPTAWMLLTTVGVAAIALIMFAMARPIIGSTRQIAEESARRALFTEIVTQLAMYSRDNGRYPEVLSRLGITNYQDGATPATLTHFQYTSDGNSYELKCSSVLRSEQYVARTNLKERSSQPTNSPYSSSAADSNR